MKRLISISDDLLSRTTGIFSRFLFNEISLSGKLNGIVGGRGIGSTSLLLQIMKRRRSQEDRALYANLEDFYFSSTSLFDFAREFYTRGGTHLFLDNLHKYQGSDRDLVMISDEMPDLNITFSTITQGEGGLHESYKKKAEIHYLPGLSFREFLELKYQFAFPVIEFDELLELNRSPGISVLNRIRPLQYFEEYLNEGYYPLAHNTTAEFQNSIMFMLNNTLEGDLSALYHLDYNSVGKIRQLMLFLADNGPIKPNIEKLALEVSTTRDSLLKFIKYLNMSGLVNIIHRKGEDHNFQNKPARIYLNNSNLINVISTNNIPREAILETFLLNQLQYEHKVQLSDNGGFFVDGKYNFEFDWKLKSGRKESRKQGGYYICEGLDYQSGTKIPLWMFGFLY